MYIIFKPNQILKFPRDPNLAQAFLHSRCNSFHRITEHRHQLKFMAQSQAWGSNNKLFREEGLRVRDCLLLFWKQSKPTAFSVCTLSAGKEQHQWQLKVTNICNRKGEENSSSPFKGKKICNKIASYSSFPNCSSFPLIRLFIRSCINRYT